MELQYFKADFTGVFRNTKSNQIGQHTFSNVHWEYVTLENLVKLETDDIEKLKSGFYYFTKLLKQKRRFRKNTDIFIPHGESEYLSGDLTNFLVRDFQLNESKLPDFKNLGNGFTQVSGKSYFAIPKVIKPLPILPIIPTNGQALNLFGRFNLNNNVGYSNTTSSISEVPQSGGCFKNQISSVSAGNQVLPSSGDGCFRAFGKNTSGSGCIGNIFRLIGLIYLLPSLMYLWYSNPLIFWVVSILSLIWFITRFLRIRDYFSWIGWLLLLFVAYYWSKNYRLIKSDLKQTENKKGSIKIQPPKEDANSFRNNERDFLTAKEINWYDFVNHYFSLVYNTSAIDFLDAHKNHSKLSSLQSNSSVEYFSKVYHSMMKHDLPYIDSVIFKISELARKNKLTKLEVAEQVTTLIQEIPYCLVHDQSCNEAVNNSNNRFITEYHQSGKPCLPNIVAGVQSPYEFLHNLKGDCDTRSLLAHAILTKLGISSSIWVSEVYGHSILGVGLPVGSGNYKEINGVNHYAVELTAKGYRLGMISPEHRNMENWDITLFN